MKKGLTFSLARRITIGAVIVLSVAGLLLRLGTGSLSSFGWQEIAAICPLGAIEGFLASRTIFPRALIMLVVIIILGILLGKVFCAWLCPVPPLRRLLTPHRKQSAKNSKAVEKSTAIAPASAPASSLASPAASPAASTAASAACASCNGCASQRAKLDSRHLVLGGALLSTAVFGFPVFCIICPVGLVFATIIAFWRWIGFNDLTISLIAFPAILLVEVLVLRKWCLKLCPLGAVASLLAIPNRLFRPKVDANKCLRSQGKDCHICQDSCEEGLDPHLNAGLHECSKCGQCIDNCPTSAISLPLLVRPKAQD